MNESLGEALPKEQARIRELILQYRDPILNGAGELAARMMERDLQETARSVMEDDIVAMIRCYQNLKGYHE